jgi:hypothetical protein
MFDELERHESKAREHERHQAARVIQRVFRERYAVPMMRRAMASVRIQAVIRGFLTRRHYQERVEARRQQQRREEEEREGREALTSRGVVSAACVETNESESSRALSYS